MTIEWRKARVTAFACHSCCVPSLSTPCAVSFPPMPDVKVENSASAALEIYGIFSLSLQFFTGNVCTSLRYL